MLISRDMAEIQIHMHHKWGGGFWWRFKDLAMLCFISICSVFHEKCAKLSFFFSLDIRSRPPSGFIRVVWLLIYWLWIRLIRWLGRYKLNSIELLHINNLSTDFSLETEKKYSLFPFTRSYLEWLKMRFIAAASGIFEVTVNICYLWFWPFDENHQNQLDFLLLSESGFLTQALF